MDEDNGGLGDGGVLDPSQMISELGKLNGEASEIAVPEKFGEIGRDAFHSALVEATNGQLKDYSSLQEILGLQSKYQSLEQKAAELEQKAGVNPYANDYIKRLNELHQGGATDKEISFFQDMQRLDVDQMSPIDVLRYQIMQKYPNMDKEGVNAYLEDEVGDWESLSAGEKVKIEMRAADARHELSKLKVDSGKPESIRSKEAFDQQQNRTLNYWQSVEKSIPAIEKYTVGFKTSGGEDFGYDFPIPESFREQLQQARVNILMQSGIKQGDVKGYQETTDAFTKSLIFANFGEEMIRNAVEHATSKAKQSVAQKHHNVNPVNRGSGVETVAISNETKAFIADYKKQY